MVSKKRPAKAACPPVRKRLLRDHWTYRHPVPAWVQAALPESAGRIKVIERAALIDDTGRELDRGCDLCLTRGYECKVLRPVHGVKIRCARCTNYSKVCSLSNDQSWEKVEDAFRRNDEEEGKGEVEADADADADAEVEGDGDETEIEEVEDDDGGRDEEGVEAENFGVAQPQGFGEAAEYNDLDGDEVYNEEEMRIILQNYHPRALPTSLSDIHSGRMYFPRMDVTGRHVRRVYYEE